MMDLAKETETRILRQFSGRKIDAQEVENQISQGAVVLELKTHWAPESAPQFYAFPEGTNASTVGPDLVSGWKYLPKVTQLGSQPREVVAGVSLTGSCTHLGLD